jgi:hypothetical protein
LRNAGKWGALGITINLFHWIWHDKFLKYIFGIHSLPVAFSTYIMAYSVHQHGFKFVRFGALFGLVLGANAS